MPIQFKCLAVVLFFCIVLAPSRTVAAILTTEQAGEDWIFLVDTSASMRGMGGGGAVDILDDVKTTLHSFVESCNFGDSVEIFTFDSKIIPAPTVRIVDGRDKVELYSIIDHIDAKGDRTLTGEAILAAFKHYDNLRRSNAGKLRGQALVLFTDGIEDTRGYPNARRLETIPLERWDMKPHTFIVWLGQNGEVFQKSTLHQFAERLGLGNKSRILYRPAARDIPSVVKQIRALIPSTVYPSTLNFGSIAIGGTSVALSLGVNSARPTSLRFALLNAGPGVALKEPSKIISIPRGNSSVQIRLAVAANAVVGPVRATLQIITDEVRPRELLGSLAPKADELTVSVSAVVVRGSVLRRVLAGLVALALLVAAFLILSLRKGGPIPWISELTSRRKLEGEIRITPVTHSRDGREAIDLSRFKVLELGSVFYSDTPAAAVEARLTPFGKHNAKRIHLTVERGPILVNDVDRSDVDLKDGDVLKFPGGTKITLSGLGFKGEDAVFSEEE
jgi:von Willebrand factor type A domain